MSSQTASGASGAATALTFPPDFRFGAATAAHQVEGGNRLNDWWAFEEQAGRIADSTRSGAACEHYERYPQDLDLLGELHLDTYRFSIEWARVEPEAGRYDEAALAHYADMAEACRVRGIMPSVTLYHFTLPRWFAERGGWLARDSVDHFERYVKKVADSLATRVDQWVTINEPIVYLYHSYLLGQWPPAHTRFDEMVRAGRNLIRAHRRAYQILHAHSAYTGRSPAVGIAKHLRIFDPERPGNPRDAWAARTQEYGFNWSFLDAIETGRFRPPMGFGRVDDFEPCTQDFVGVNYYTRDRVHFAPLRLDQLFGVQSVTAGAPINDLSWEIYPEGLLRLLKEVHRRYQKPIWITENGIADGNDSRRSAFLVQHLAGVAQAIAEGIPVKGYMHWSLMDNFEWAEGFAPRFGLYAVDYATQTRSPRASSAIYAAIARDHAIPAQWLERYRF